MNIKQTLVALALLAVGIAVFGWVASRTQPMAQKAIEPALVAAATSTEEGPYLSITVAYPAAPPKIRTAIEQKMGQIVAEFKQNTNIDHLTPEDIKIQGLGGEKRYTLDASVKTYAAPNYQSYAYTVYEDTLGAHPNASYQTFVFDANGDPVSLGQLLGGNPHWLEELSLLVSNDVVAQYKKRAEVDDVTGLLYDEGLAPNEENFSNFVVDGDMLVILIPPYQVAAYAVGSFEVRIPLNDISH